MSLEFPVHTPEQVQYFEEVGAHFPLVEDVIVNATFGENRAVPSSVNTINLGQLGTDITSLRERSSVLGNNLEVGSFIYVTFDARIEAFEKIIECDKKFDLPFEPDLGIINIQASTPQERQSRLIGALVHTHPTDSPNTGFDLLSMLLEENHPYSAVASIVATPQYNYAVFRGYRTPFMSYEKAFNILKTDEENYEIDFWNSINSGMTREETLALLDKKTDEYYKKSYQRFGLQHFVGASDSGILRKIK
jgi:hypothetical protein